MKRAVVTGGAGFVGAPLVRRLVSDGVGVVVVDDLSRGRRDALAPGVDLVVSDVRDHESVARVIAEHRPEVVFHLAALHFIPDCDRDPAATMAINRDASGALGRAAAAHGVERLVFSSTAAVYRPSDLPHGEDDDVAPVDVYGESKVGAERLLLEALGPGRVVVARLFNVFGPGETNPHVIPEIVAQATQGTTLRLGRTDTVRDYVFVDDVARALVAVAVSGSAPQRVNVGSGRGSTVLDIVDATGLALVRTLDVVTDPARLRPVDRPRLVADTTLLGTVVDWRPLSLVEGLRRLLVSGGHLAEPSA